MGEVIRKTADVGDIRKDVLTTLGRARERGGKVAEIAEARLGPHVALMQAALAALEAAAHAEDATVARLLAADAVADETVGAVADEVWNKLGRPAHDAFYDGLFPGGIQTYTRAEPRREALLLTLLADNLAQTKHPRVEEASWRAWSERVAAVQAPLAAASQVHESAEARTFIADRAFRASVRSAWFDLVRAKRDYANAGLNEADIHAIIPDRPAAHAAPKE